MRPATLVRSTTATTLSAVAAALKVASHLTHRLAGLVRPEPQRPADEPTRAGTGSSGAATAERDRDRPARAAGEGVVRMPPTEPVPDGPTHVRTHDTHVEALAAGTAAEVLAAIPTLSTDELGRLYEHEASHKRRKSVLAAVERAADPRTHTPDGSGGGHVEPMPEAGGVPVGGGPAR